MWYFIGFASTIFFAGAFFRQKDCYPRVKETVVNGFSAIIEGVKLVRENGFGVCMVWSKQIITNYISKRLVETHHRYYIIHYPYGVTWYKMIIPRKRGPCRITRVTCVGKDVTSDVLKYMGPSHTFHGVKITPKMLGFSELSFHFLDNTVQTFGETEPITL